MSGSSYNDPNASFRELLAEAVRELSETGYVSPARVDEWIARLRNAAERDLGPDISIDTEIREGLGRVFERFVGGRKIDEVVPGVSRYTKAMVAPRLYAELDRRILASADLIKLWKAEAVERTLRRFRGWSTSIPPGGDDTINKSETRQLLGEELRKYRYHKRLVDNDQGHKLVANVAAIVAEGAGAIAMRWNSHGPHDASYDARPDHVKRDGKVYLIRGSWADKENLVRPTNGYTDEITSPGQEVNCRCWATYITSPRKLSDEMLTKRGQEWVARGKEELARRMSL